MTTQRQEALDVIRARARELMRGALQSHGWDHVERVRRLALAIARDEGADLFVVEAAALLHDIGRSAEDRARGEVCHAEVSEELARPILREAGVGPAAAEAVCHCVVTHRYRGTRAPESLEARVLFDADKLDSIGATGLGRAFLFAGEVGARLHNPEVPPETTDSYGEEDSAWREFSVKLRFIRDRMTTAAGRRLAAARHEFMERFFARLDREAAGEE